MVGGTAVALHGYFRQSHDPSGQLMGKHDLDFWYNPTYVNRLISKIFDVEVPYINYDDLIKSKVALGRAKDIEDIDQLKLRRNNPE